MSKTVIAALLIAAAVATVLLQRASITPEFVAAPPAAVPAASPSTVSGQVISIAETPRRATDGGREAIVRLATGESVRAFVPDGCIVLAGQTTRLVQRGDSGSRRYIVAENGRNS